MKSIKRLFDFYINASIHVALAAVAFTYITCLNFEHTLNLELAILIFCGTVTGYNFVKYAGIAKLHHRSLTRNLQLIQLFSLVVFIVFLWFLVDCSWRELLLLVIISLLTSAYAIPFLPKKKNLRAVKGLKVFIIALVWTLATVLLPLAEFEGNNVKEFGYFSLHRFVLILILLIPFEIRDFYHDDKGLKTLPQILGVRLSKVLGIFLVIFQFWLAIEFRLYNQLFVLFLLTFILLAVIIVSNPKRFYFFTSFWVEFIPVLWCLILFLVNCYNLIDKY